MTTAPQPDEFDATDLIAAIEAQLTELPQGLQDHIARSREIGADLCEIHSIDPDRVDLAIAAHDLCRAVPGEELLAEAGRRGWEPDPVERADPSLLHGPVAALRLMQEFGIDDRSVIEAVTWHTTYAPNLGPVAAITFLADKIDPHKIDRKPWLGGVRELAYAKRAEEAVETYLSELIARLIEDGQIAHTRALDALNYLRLGRRALL